MLIEVRGEAGATTGMLECLGRRYECALGRAGIIAPKREGDGATPCGQFPLRQAFHRPDRAGAPTTGLPVAAIARDDGWCDDPASGDYNRQVRLPHPGRSEAMWREDGLYDLLAVIGFNDDPPRSGAGSAIFLHVAGEKGGALAPTEGCVALRKADLLQVLEACWPGAMIRIALA